MDSDSDKDEPLEVSISESVVEPVKKKKKNMKKWPATQQYTRDE